MTTFNTPQVQSSLHVGVPGNSSFRCQQSGPASRRLLYPTLIKKIRVLIYNGDADICVPYVQSALHVGVPGNSSFRYQQSGPASRLLYPALIKKIRVLIYNGDADICVPYVGNEEWTTKMAADGHMTKTQAWHPWYASSGIPAGYATNYNVTGVPGKTFTFITIRLAGHMVPTFQPGPALAFITRFFNDQ
eukprot:gene20423-31436_t